MYLTHTPTPREQTNLTFTDSSFSTMVKFTVQTDGMLAVTGKTYDHRDALKNMGGRWDKFGKCWVVGDTPENKKILKSLTTKRRCGHCGETGHFKPNCPAYHEERKRDIRMKANDFGSSGHATTSGSSQQDSATVCSSPRTMATKTSRSSFQRYVAFVTTGVVARRVRRTACPDLT